jgi:hypothetical protein
LSVTPPDIFTPIALAAETLTIALPEILPSAAVTVSAPAETPVTTPVEELIEECAAVSVHTGELQGAVEESEKSTTHGVVASRHQTVTLL